MPQSRQCSYVKDEEHSYKHKVPLAGTSAGSLFVDFTFKFMNTVGKKGFQKQILTYVVNNPTEETAKSDFERRVAAAIAAAQPMYKVVTKMRPERASKKSRKAISPHDYRMYWEISGGDLAQPLFLYTLIDLQRYAGLNSNTRAAVAAPTPAPPNRTAAKEIKETSPVLVTESARRLTSGLRGQSIVACADVVATQVAPAARPCANGNAADALFCYVFIFSLRVLLLVLQVSQGCVRIVCMNCSSFDWLAKVARLLSCIAAPIVDIKMYFT
jgi:hypothetical protein